MRFNEAYIFILFFIAVFCMGVMVTKGYYETHPKVITTIVNLPPSDDELIKFWFGGGDTASLRKRICNAK